MREVQKRLYSGELDGPYLHAANLAIWENLHEEAVELLNNEFVLQNISNNEALRNKLLAKIGKKYEW